MKVFILALFVFTISGCGTNSISNEKARAVPNSQIFNHEITKVSDGSGMVIIKRDSGIMGSPCLTRVYLDGKDVADLNAGEKITIYPKIGMHIFSARPKGACGGDMSEQSGRVEEGGKLTFRVGYGTYADFGLHPTAF